VNSQTPLKSLRFVEIYEFAMDTQIIALCAGGDPPRVGQVDAVLTDDGSQVFFYLYLIDETLTDGPLIAIVDLPRPVDADTFDAAAFVEAFWQAGAPVLTRH
jgi:hypothetical protein